jgi:hypothetical protein
MMRKLQRDSRPKLVMYLAMVSYLQVEQYRQRPNKKIQREIMQFLHLEIFCTLTTQPAL